ncbi:MAG TPA: glycosyltransferase family 4 protein [Capillimicrobium sp.]
MSAPTVYFVCPDYDAPSGGIRVIYRHVEHLVAAGIPAAVVHKAPGFRPTWFDTGAVPVTSVDAVDPTPADLLVIPEIYGPDLASIAPGVPKAVFNQNAYNTFAGYTADPRDLRAPYGHPEVVGAVVVSEDNAEYLRYAFPGLDVRRTVNAVDPARFFPAPKRRRLAYMPRKNAEQALQVIRILAFRGALADVEVVALDGMSEDAVAAALRETLVFLSFGAPEGFGLPPAEAMACGCAVVGYHGMGGREFFTPDVAVPVTQGDVVGFARAVEEALATPAAELEALGARASAAVTARYSPEAERASVVETWGALLAGRPALAAAA